MTAELILAHWDRVQLTTTPDRWLMVLRVARTGAAGISSYDLASLNRTHAGNCQAMLRDAISDGLVAKGYAPKAHTAHKTSVRVIYTITARGLAWLGLAPMPTGEVSP